MFPFQPFKITDKNITLSGSQVTLQPKVVAVVITVTTQEKGSGFEYQGTFLHVLVFSTQSCLLPQSKDTHLGYGELDDFMCECVSVCLYIL